LLVGGALLGRDAIASATADTTSLAREPAQPLSDDQAASEDRLSAMARVPPQVTVIGGLHISGAYFVLFWTLGGLTSGKALMGLRVVTRDGRRLSRMRSAVRLFGYLVSLPL